MDKHIKQFFVLAFLTASLTLFGIFLTFAVFEVRASNYYTNLKIAEPNLCGPNLRNKVIFYSQNGKQAVSLTPEEDQIFRFQLKVQALGPVINTLNYYHDLYLNNKEKNNPQLLTSLYDYLQEEKDLSLNTVSELKEMPLPIELESCRRAILSAWSEAMLLVDNVLVLPQEKHQEKYERFYTKNQQALEICQKEAASFINYPSINEEDLVSLSQPLACFITNSQFKSRWQNEGESYYRQDGLREIENIFAKKQYHPLLSRYFLTWRASKQFINHGGANSNYIPNEEYDEKRIELYEIIRQHLVSSPQDSWAKNQLIELINYPDIVRGGAGNSVLDYYYFDTGK